MPTRAGRPDPHGRPVPEEAWEADRRARARGRVEIFNATRPGGLDGWTMDAAQYQAMRDLIHEMLDVAADTDGTIALATLVEAAAARYGDHALFPTGNTRNYLTYTKVDLEARQEIERVPGSRPQRVRRTRQA